MDPVTLIVAALVAGASAGLKDTASSAIKDAYNGLRGWCGGSWRAARRELVLDRHEQDPQVWDKPLAQELTAAGVADDPDLVSARRR